MLNLNLRIAGGVILFFLTLAAISAVLAGGPNDKLITSGSWKVLEVLGEVSNFAGMGHTMFGATVVTLMLAVITVLYCVFMFFIPASIADRRVRAD